MNPSDKLQIRLLIGKQTYPITVRRDKEEVFRKAAQHINELWAKYEQTSPGQGADLYKTMVLLQNTVRLLEVEQANDTQPFVNTLTELTKEIEETLGA